MPQGKNIGRKYPCHGPNCSIEIAYWGGSSKPKYCSAVCRKSHAEAEKAGVKKYKPCTADGCEMPIKGRRVTFCSDKCKLREAKRRYRATRRVKEGKGLNPRGGDGFNLFMKQGYYAALLAGDMVQREVVEAMDTTATSVSRWKVRADKEEEARAARRGWEAPEQAMGMTQFLIEKDIEDLVVDFVKFRDGYFRTSMGEKYFTSPFHIKWITTVLKALQTGGEAVILSPPRHGKTDLLIHFSVWLIAHVPNIRILWVGGNEDIAQQATSSVKDHLEDNESLVEDYCEPNQRFKPENRSGKSWSANRFTVATRTVAGIKSPTMVAIGRGGKILSRDTDLIVCDDIEDHQSTIQPSNRQNTRNWMTTTVGSRKEEHTAVIVIGSRQHTDDLYGHLLDTDGWEKIVEEAHDSACDKPEDEFDVHRDCMLFPEMRTYRWLMSRLSAAVTTGGRHMYEMVYLNKTIAEGMEIFKKGEVDACLNHLRGIGVLPKSSWYLVAGLDPAATSYQAAFAWGIDPKAKTLNCIDIDNTKGGGILPALQIIKDWFFAYNLRHWVIEENLFHGGIRADPRIRQFVSAHGIYLEAHRTGMNKWDPTFGITSLAPLFTEGLVDLPYLDSPAQFIIDQYRKQLFNFANDVTITGKRRKQTSDIVMASWFPLKVYRRKIKEFQATMEVQYEQSYSDWTTFSLNEAPW